MIRLLKWVSIIALLAGIGLAVWTVFALWTGLYSVYSYPPSEDHPDGATLVIEREDGEPAFNSPDYIPAPKKAPSKKGGVGFGKIEFRSMKPVEIRTVYTLPYYVEYFYKKSLNEKQLELYEKGKLKQKTGGTKGRPR